MICDADVPNVGGSFRVQVRHSLKLIYFSEKRPFRLRPGAADLVEVSLLLCFLYGFFKDVQEAQLAR